MEILTINLKKIARALVEKDIDWVHLNIGYEGIGKSTLGMHICKIVDPDFNIDKIVFNLEQFRANLEKNKKGSAIMIDEGSEVAFSRESMIREVRDMIKTLMTCRQFNQFICINIPTFHTVDRYVREERVKSLTRVVLRGRFFFYNRAKILSIKQHKYTNRYKFPKPNFKENYPKFTGKLWEQYLKKKEIMTLGKEVKPMGVTAFARKIGKSRFWVYSHLNEIPHYKDISGEIRIKPEGYIP